MKGSAIERVLSTYKEHEPLSPFHQATGAGVLQEELRLVSTCYVPDTFSGGRSYDDPLRLQMRKPRLREVE